MVIGSVAAVDDTNIQDNNLTSDSSQNNLEIIDESDNELSASDTSPLMASKTIVVDQNGGHHNEMNEKKITTAIVNANPGDTIIINGESYEHCHIVINKTLTIKTNVGTLLTHCGNQGAADSGYQGIFYITPEASGTVIEGFNFGDNNLYNDEGYAVLIRSASNVVIKNCNINNGGIADAIRIENAKNTLIQNVTIVKTANAIKIKNSNGITVKDSNISDSNYGIYDINSTKSSITSNNIKNNKVAGIGIAGSSSNTTITSNNVTNNNYGFELTSSNNIDILSNYIAFNTKYGVYVNCEVIKIRINGNFFNRNTLGEVYDDLLAKNLWTPGGEKLQEVNNNYMIGVGERPVYRSFSGGVFLGYVFEINENVNCPVLYFIYEQEAWFQSGNYELQLSEITQIKKGIYSISIVDENGTVAKGLSSVPVTFYVNKQGNSATPKEGDVYKTVVMNDGTATVRFYSDDFKESGNVITAVVPTPGTLIDAKVSKTFNVNDSDIPGNLINTKITVNGFTTGINSNEQLIATLTDINGNAIEGESLTFNINSKNINAVTNTKGQASIKISQAKVGTYTVTVKYVADANSDYYGSSSQAKVVVKKLSVKIVSSNLNMIPKLNDYFPITLKDSSSNLLANQKVTFKVNGKSYTKSTNSKGIAKVKLKFSKNNKNYKIKVSYKGSEKYNAVSKTNKIIVKYSSKKVKLSTPTVEIPLKTSKYYTVSLKDTTGKAISKQKVIVKINGKKYNKKTNSKGEAKILVKFTSLKDYKVSASYKGSKIYKKASSSGKIKVVKTTSIITLSSISMLPNETKSYTATLKADNKPLAKQKLVINVNGKSYSVTTDNKGQASIDVNFPNSGIYNVNVNYAGTNFYKSASANGKITVLKFDSQIESCDRTYSKDGEKDYPIILKDNSGNILPNQTIKVTLNNQNYTKITDLEGKAIVNLSDLTEDSFITISYDGSDNYNSVLKTNLITISNKTNTVFVDSGLSISDIQNIFDNALNESNVEFLGSSYSDISLNINKSLNIYSSNNSILNAKLNTPVFIILSGDVNVSGFSINGNSADAIIIQNANNVSILNNNISNTLDESKSKSYADGSLNMLGYGVGILNSSDIIVCGNSIGSFESGIFAVYSSNFDIVNNTIKQNNYGIKYGWGVANTHILNNEICESVGLYIMTVPEGPSGYGILLNNSAVNVTINANHIYANHLGISLDANYSTGIVITQNTITDSVLEGIRFNAGYDLAENAVEPHITDNAIYRNARGPSMMILGELSANPEGIYHNGLYNASDRLQLEANWYGTNQIITWDNDTGYVGYGTMCPRINTTEIKFNNLSYAEGNYSIVFYKNGEVASNLSKFDMYATLNRGTDKEIEVVFDVINGVGTFTFDKENYNDANNLIEISVGSLLYSTSRIFKVTYSYNVPENEIKH